MSEIDWRETVRNLERTGASKSEARQYCLSKLAALKVDGDEEEEAMREIRRALDSRYEH
jgi:hypothetical protein